jgi:hypothetical protein
VIVSQLEQKANTVNALSLLERPGGTPQLVQCYEMGNEQRVSAPAIYALKEALTTIFWYKNDLRGFLRACISDPALLNAVDWHGYKRQIASDIVDALVANQRKYGKDLEKLFADVASMNSFRHLEQLDDGKKKVAAAKAAVEEVKRLSASHEVAADEERAIEERRKRAAERLAQSAAVQSKLRKLLTGYTNLVTERISAHERGYALETLFYELFALFDLDPKASFKNTGEQIDGAFNLEGDFLFEGKWQKPLVAVQELDGFAGKVKRKLDNTLGLFFSMNGFSPNGIAAHSKERPVLLLMTGEDLMAVLEGRVDFVTLLLRKKRHASLTGNILLRVSEMM